MFFIYIYSVKAGILKGGAKERNRVGILLPYQLDAEAAVLLLK